MIERPNRLRGRLPVGLMPPMGASLEDQLFQLVTLAWAVVTLAFIVPTNLLLAPIGVRPISTAVLVAFALFCLWAWRHQPISQRVVTAFFVGHLVALDVQWFPGAGSTGATVLFNFSLILVPIVFARGRIRAVMVAAILANVILLFALEALNPEWVVHHATPLDRLIDVAATTLIALCGIGAAIWMVVRGYERQRRRLAAANEELAGALAEVRTLRGLLPICAWCRRLRDEDGGWSSLEAYVESHTEARMTHGLCPDCEARLEREAGLVS